MMRTLTSRIALASLAIVAIPIAALAAAEPPAKNSAYYTKRTCEVDTPTGSRLGGRRRCRTQAERDQEKAESKNVVERVQSRKACNSNAAFGQGGC